MSWLGRLREDQRNGHWTDLVPLLGEVIAIFRGIWLIFKDDKK